MSGYSRRQEITPVSGDWLVERRGFEPLTSRCKRPRAVTPPPPPLPRA